MWAVIINLAGRFRQIKKLWQRPMVEIVCLLGLIVMKNSHGIKATTKKIEGFKKFFLICWKPRKKHIWFRLYYNFLKKKTLTLYQTTFAKEINKVLQIKLICLYAKLNNKSFSWAYFCETPTKLSSIQKAAFVEKFNLQLFLDFQKKMW